MTPTLRAPIDAPVIELKCWPEFFEEKLAGRKWFELRKNDRPYAVGTILREREWDPKAGDYTGRTMDERVTYILRESVHLAPGYIAMGTEPLASPDTGEGLGDPSARLERMANGHGTVISFRDDRFGKTVVVEIFGPDRVAGFVPLSMFADFARTLLGSPAPAPAVVPSSVPEESERVPTHLHIKSGPACEAECAISTTEIAKVDCLECLRLELTRAWSAAQPTGEEVRSFRSQSFEGIANEIVKRCVGPDSRCVDASVLRNQIVSALAKVRAVTRAELIARVGQLRADNALLARHGTSPWFPVLSDTSGEQQCDSCGARFNPRTGTEEGTWSPVHHHYESCLWLAAYERATGVEYERAATPASDARVEQAKREEQERIAAGLIGLRGPGGDVFAVDINEAVAVVNGSAAPPEPRPTYRVPAAYREPGKVVVVVAKCCNCGAPITDDASESVGEGERICKACVHIIMSEPAATEEQPEPKPGVRAGQVRKAESGNTYETERPLTKEECGCVSGCWWAKRLSDGKRVTVGADNLLDMTLVSDAPPAAAHDDCICSRHKAGHASCTDECPCAKPAPKEAAPVPKTVPVHREEDGPQSSCHNPDVCSCGCFTCNSARERKEAARAGLTLEAIDAKYPGGRCDNSWARVWTRGQRTLEIAQQQDKSIDANRSWRAGDKHETEEVSITTMADLNAAMQWLRGEAVPNAETVLRPKKDCPALRNGLHRGSVYQCDHCFPPESAAPAEANPDGGEAERREAKAKWKCMHGLGMLEFCQDCPSDDRILDKASGLELLRHAREKYGTQPSPPIHTEASDPLDQPVTRREWLEILHEANKDDASGSMGILLGNAMRRIGSGK